MRIVPALILCCSLFACKKENKNYNSYFTVINAVPNSTGYSLVVGNAVIDTAVKFGVPQFDLLAPAATTTLRWKQNAAVDFDSTILTDIPNTAKFSLLFYDSLQRYKSFLVRDYFNQLSSNKQGYLRFFPMVIGTDTLLLANDTNKVLIGRQPFGSFPANFTAVDSFATQLKLYNGNKLLDSLPGIVVRAGKYYSAYAIGVLNQKGDKRPRLVFHAHD